MRKHLLLIACFVAFIGVAKAQNEFVILSYAPTSVAPTGNAGFGGLAFYWGYMFPASMLEEYAGQYINIKNPCLLKLGMDFFYFSLLPKTFIIFALQIKSFHNAKTYCSIVAFS